MVFKHHIHSLQKNEFKHAQQSKRWMKNFQGFGWTRSKDVRPSEGIFRVRRFFVKVALGFRWLFLLHMCNHSKSLQDAAFGFDVLWSLAESSLILLLSWFVFLRVADKSDFDCARVNVKGLWYLVLPELAPCLLWCSAS